MERLYDKLKAYSESDFYAFHMPGHKRNKALLGIELPYDLDITEIDGFDDLHHADGILKEEQERAARVFGAEESHFLVNGSTAGILSAVMGCTHRGDKILVARHCHKSIYHAIYMNGLVPRYVYPEFDISMHMNGEISKEDVAKALAAEPDIKAVVIVSPNYDGVVSDVKGIAEVAHSYRIPLIVDEAHGPHFGFHPVFPGRPSGGHQHAAHRGRCGSRPVHCKAHWSGAERGCNAGSVKQKERPCFAPILVPGPVCWMHTEKEWGKPNDPGL